MTKQRNIETHPPVTLMFYGSDATFDGTTYVAPPIAFGRGTTPAPQTFHHVVDAQTNIGRIDVYQAIQGAWDCQVPVGRPDGAPIAGMRYCDTNEFINAFLLWQINIYETSASSARTIEHYFRFAGVDQNNAAVASYLFQRNLPLFELAATYAYRGDQEIVIPGSVIEITSDATAGDLTVEMVLFPITDPGSLGEQCQQMATRLMLGHNQVS